VNVGGKLDSRRGGSITWNKWHFQRSELYPLSEVVDACDDRIREGEIIRRDSKNKWFANGEARTSGQRLVSEDGSGLGNLAIQ